MNPLLLTDSYKVTHWKQYPPNTSRVYSYFESRGGMFHDLVFFGLQAQIERYLVGSIITFADVAEAHALVKLHFGTDRDFNIDGWTHIVRDHGGKLPISIKAAPEGSVIPTSNVLITVENTCPQCFWLTNYIETLLVQNWYPITVATISREAKKIILKYLERTGDPALIDFKLHDFGYRGVSSVESAGIGGAAHLVNFKGTDTLAALDYCAKHYDEPCAGFSVPASEHSTITSWEKEHERDAFANMLEMYPDGIVACVSDSFDIMQACRYWGEDLKSKVLARNGTLVVRPDSGYPPQVVCDVLKALDESFGSRTNGKGYQVLDSHVRVIQGDGVNLDTIEEILHQMQFHRFSADNLTFGMGGALLQQCNRDTLKFAFKCSEVVVNGSAREVFKQPVSDPGKNSKRGRLALVQRDGKFYTYPEAAANGTNCLQEVFRDGELLMRTSLKDIRELAAIPQEQLA